MYFLITLALIGFIAYLLLRGGVYIHGFWLAVGAGVVVAILTTLSTWMPITGLPAGLLAFFIVYAKYGNRYVKSPAGFYSEDKQGRDA